jgi:hypothetical protein
MLPAWCGCGASLYVPEHLAGIRGGGDSYLDANRDEFEMVYPIASPGYYSTYFRPYRLELDTPADLEMIRWVYTLLDKEPSLHEVIDLLDENPDLACMNAHVAERTGPLTTYTPEQRRGWMAQMVGSVVDWQGDWSWLLGNGGGEKAIWCDSGRCYLGHARHVRGGVTVLVRPDKTEIEGNARVNCSCGAGRRWYG